MPMMLRLLEATVALVLSSAQTTVAHIFWPHGAALMCTVLLVLRHTPVHDGTIARAGSAAAGHVSATGASVSATQASNRDTGNRIVHSTNTQPSRRRSVTTVRQSVALVRQLASR